MIKSFVFAVGTAALLFAICAVSASAREAEFGSLVRFANLVEQSRVHQGVIVGDSLIVVERGSHAVVCVLRMTDGDDVQLSATGSLNGCEAIEIEVLDYDYLDRAAVGVVLFDRANRRWSLVHHFAATQVSNEMFIEILNRFTSEVAETSMRYGSEITSERW